jgi:hypothetical protein
LKGLVWLCLLLAGAATAVLGFVVLRGDRNPSPAPPPTTAPPPAAAPLPAAEETLRPYETLATLTEDLRDALAGPPELLAPEVARVSERLAPKARTVLVSTAPEEASPKVRALLVFAAGSHVPDEEVLLAFLGDREPVVRRAAAIATARTENTRLALQRAALVLPGVWVRIGRRLPEATRRALEERLSREEDEGVRGTLAAALGR